MHIECIFKSEEKLPKGLIAKLIKIPSKSKAFKKNNANLSIAMSYLIEFFMVKQKSIVLYMKPIKSYMYSSKN